MTENHHSSPAKFMWVSIVASIATILLKAWAYNVTGSVGLLSDALESLINLVAAVAGLVLLTIAFAPPDKKHPFGHHKAEYFSSVLEGILILLASIAIGVTAIERFINPHELEGINTGLIISVVASGINLLTALYLLKAGKKYNSIALEADAHHLMSDVWTTGGVLAGLLLVSLTNWIWLDPLMAVLVALNIIFMGIKLIKKSVIGLMDSALPEAELDKIRETLLKHENLGVGFHALYTRVASSKYFISFHLLMPEEWTVAKAHEITILIENDIKVHFPGADIFIHPEPINDPASFDDYIEKNK